jgi:hypothetical protein
MLIVPPAGAATIAELRDRFLPDPNYFFVHAAPGHEKNKAGVTPAFSMVASFD